jgi:hypothetical protein
MNFTFEHDCENAPMLLNIEVSYTIWTWPGTYDQPAELDIKDSKYTIKCGRLDLTAFINSSTDEKLITEIEDAVNTAIWNHHFNM